MAIYWDFHPFISFAAVNCCSISIQKAHQAPTNFFYIYLNQSILFLLLVSSSPSSASSDLWSNADFSVLCVQHTPAASIEAPCVSFSLLVISITFSFFAYTLCTLFTVCCIPTLWEDLLNCCLDGRQPTTLFKEFGMRCGDLTTVLPFCAGEEVVS